MKKSILLILFVIIASVATNIGAQSNVVTLTDKNFQKEVVESDKTVLVFFSANWNGPSRLMNPTVSKFADTYKGQFKVGKLDIDANPNTTRRYGINSIPCVMEFRGGTMIKCQYGNKTDNQLRNKFGFK